MTLENDRKFAIEIVRQLSAAGFQALWAGGCVRDWLMGNSPSDFDVATSATPQEVRALFGKRRTLAVGESFGVIVVMPPRQRDAQQDSQQAPFVGANQIEVATFRTDGGYSDGRRPDSVVFSSAEEDALRRDFTINGMFFDPVVEKVIDYVGGRQDLEQRQIRAIGQPADRIAEDKLRMLRAVRFAARFDFQIEEETLTAIRRFASDIHVVSSERIAVEMQKTLCTAKPAWAMQQWFELGLLAAIFPKLAEQWETLGTPILRLIEAAVEQRWQTKVAAAFYVLQTATEAKTQDLADHLKQHLKLANVDARAIGFAIDAQAILEQAPKLAWSQLQPCLIHPDFTIALELLRMRMQVGQADCSAEDLEWLQRQAAREDLEPAPFLQGQDLIAQGLKPCPAFKEILAEAWQRQLDGDFSDRDQALAWLAQRVAAS